MKAIVCEMCGSHELVKQDGYYVCLSCGTKYAPEEAKKLMIDGSVDVSGSKVSIDSSKDVENLYTLARRAKNEGNSANAANYYKQILLKEPKSWEAVFYSNYYEAADCVIANIASAAESVDQGFRSAFDIIEEAEMPEDDRIRALVNMAFLAQSLEKKLYNAAKYHYQGIDYDIRANYRDEFLSRYRAVTSAIDHIASCLERCKDNQNEKILDTIHSLWKSRFDIVLDYWGKKSTLAEYEKDYCYMYIIERIRKYDPSFMPPIGTPTKGADPAGGCYVATAVYGSYDCPQVWTLRRFRDYSLAETWYGRAFIHTYYAISPTIVKWFGKAEWFNNIWRPKLDDLVAKLQRKGFESTPYNDRNW